MLRRLYQEQPASFEFTPANQAWAEAQITKYPLGRQASAIIPLLFRAQQQEGWLTKPAIEYVARMLDMAYIRALEVATFYFMFQLNPVGSVAHLQICGTTPCMLRGSEDLIAVCKRKIAAHSGELSADGKLSWEEVECLGACSNAPMAQIGKDYFEDLSEASLETLIDELVSGQMPRPGSRIGRFSSERAGEQVALLESAGAREEFNATTGLAVAIGDTFKHIDGTEVALRAPWQMSGQRGPIGVMGTDRPKSAVQQAAVAKAEPKPSEHKPVDVTGIAKQQAVVADKGKPEAVTETAPGGTAMAAPGQKVAQPVAQMGRQPVGLPAARGAQADDLKIIEGIGPVLEERLHGWGIFHFDQIAAWSAEEILFADENVPGFKGRCSRDKWVAQAKIIVNEGVERFLERAKTNDY